MRIIDSYFTYSVLIDIFLALLAVVGCYALVCYDIVATPDKSLLLSTTSDIANVAFTSAGFVLTFLTLLVSFKISAKPFKKKKKEDVEGAYERHTLFDLFLNSPLYTETIRHLKNGVKELIVVAILGYVLKLAVPTVHFNYLLYFVVAAIVFIAIVLWRSLLVLSGVLSVQDKKKESN